MRRLFTRFDTLPFWTAVFAVAVLVVGVYAFTANRDATNRNAELIAQQQLQLSFLCETITVLDQLNVQEARINREAINDPALKALQPYLRQRNTILMIAHLELSETRGCQGVQ